MLAAARAARQLGTSKVVLASPVASRAAAQMLAPECDDFICLATPTPFNSVAECYLDFATLSDEECVDIVRSFIRQASNDERQ